MPGFATNLTNRATTQITGLDFNSFFYAFGKPIGVGANGIYDLCAEETDETDIAASFETPILTLGSFSDKRIRFIYIGFESTGPLKIDISVDDGAYEPYTVVPKKSGRQRVSIPVSRNLEGCYWRFRVSNMRGGFFVIDRLSVFTLNVDR